LSALEASDGREVARLPEQNLLTTARFSPDGRWLAVKSYDGQSIEVIDILRGGAVLRLPRRDLEAALTLRPLDLAGFKPSGKQMLYSGDGEPAAFSGDGRKVAIADDDGLRVFTVPGARKLTQVAEEETEAVSFSPDGRWVAGASAGGEARVVAAANGTIVFSRKFEKGLSAIWFSPDSRLAATAGGDRKVHIIDVMQGKEVAGLEHRSAVDALAFSADSGRLATSSADGTARVFRISTGREVWHTSAQSGVGSVAFSPDGRWLAAGSGRMVRVYEAESGKEVARLAHQAAVISLAFSPDSSSVASASYDYTVRVLQVATGREVTRINLDGRAKAMKFEEGGRILQTASSGRLESESVISAKSDYISVQRELLRPDELIREACARLSRNLGEEQWKQYLGDRPYRKTCSRLP
jgi:WD40 repeat protein